MIILTVIVVALVFGLLILVHEFGHFLAARRSGVVVEEFGLGFPPRIFTWRRGETVYSVGAVPLGGFVRLLGEEGETRQPGSFASKPVRTRAKIIVMGVVMNLLLAYVLIAGLLFFDGSLFAGKPSDYPGAKVIGQSVVITKVEPHSAAERAGLKPGDTLARIDGSSVGDDASAHALLQDRAGHQVRLEWTGAHGQQKASVTLGTDTKRGVLGVGLARSERVHVPRWEIPFVAAIETLRVAWAVLAAIGGLFASLFVAHAPTGVAGPIGIVAIIQKVLVFGLAPLLRVVVFLSVSLAVFNVLPVPALDGGRLAFLGIEKFAGRRVKAKFENAIHLVGFWVLLGLIGVISAFDIYRLSTGKFGL